MDFIVLTKEDDFIKLLIEWIAADVLDDCWEAFIFGQILEVNGIVGREIFVFWFYACKRKEEKTGFLSIKSHFRARRLNLP